VLELLASGELPLPGGAGALVAEWLAGAARAGCRPPASLLPRLLDLGAITSLRPTLLEVLGPRGRWLARHHEPWTWAAHGATGDEEPVERRFATRGRTDRLALLRHLRGTDPGRARQLLAATWFREPAPERAALLGELLVGLSDDDEPFLEAALDDRAAAVREAAVGLLGRLPSSRWAARMAERLRPRVAVNAHRHRRLEIARPPEPDASARRDGITDRPPAGMGLSAWRLVQVVAGTPLSFWTGHLGADPGEIVALAADHAPEILTGLQAAAAAQAERADPAWAAALFAEQPLPAVLAALPPDLAAQSLARFLAGNPAPGGTVAALLTACPGPWPESLATAVVDRYIRLGARAGLEMPASLSVLAERLDPSVLPLVESWALALAGEDALRRRVRTLAYALSLRAVIHQEFP
jgi:hypothetical protein